MKGFHNHVIFATWFPVMISYDTADSLMSPWPRLRLGSGDIWESVVSPPWPQTRPLGRMGTTWSLYLATINLSLPGLCFSPKRDPAGKLASVSHNPCRTSYSLNSRSREGIWRKATDGTRSDAHSGRLYIHHWRQQRTWTVWVRYAL